MNIVVAINAIADIQVQGSFWCASMILGERVHIRDRDPLLSPHFNNFSMRIGVDGLNERGA